MVVGATRNKIETVTRKLLGQNFCIFNNLSTILLELRLLHKLKHQCNGRGLIVVRTTLNARDNRLVDSCGKRWRASIDNRTTRPTHRLVRRCHNNISVRKWTWVLSCGNEPGDVAYVRDVIGANFFSDFTDTFKVNHAWIRRCPGINHLWLTFNRKPLHLRIVNLTGLRNQ